jgi:hypothetical protein
MAKEDIVDWVPTFGGNMLGWVPTWVVIGGAILLVSIIVVLGLALKDHLEDEERKPPPLL